MKTRTMLWAVVVVVAVVVAVPCWGRSIVVSLHNHTYYSDGFDSPEEVCRKAIAAGAEVVAINDHAEMIDWTVLPQYCGLMKWHCGVSDWARDLDLARQKCERLGKKLIYGAEVGMGTNRHNHLLVWMPSESPNVKTGMQLAMELADAAGKLSDDECMEVVPECRYNEAENVLYAAAHPTNGSYPFNFGWYIDVYETFNHYHDNASTFDYIAANAGSPPRPKSIVAGTDYHCEAGTTISAFVAKSRTGNRYLPEMYRFTIVGTEDNSAASVLQAIRKRRCYAAFAGARITEATCWPGGECRADEPLSLEVENIGFDYANYFSGMNTDNVEVLAVNGDDGRSSRWVESFDHSFSGDGSFELDLRRLDNGDKWFVYLDISRQIVTSAITVLPSGSSSSSPVIADSNKGDGPRVTMFPPAGAVMTAVPADAPAENPTPEAVEPSGEKFVGREPWGDGAIVATYVRKDDRFGTLTVKYEPSGGVLTCPIDLTQNVCGLDQCVVKERIPMEYTNNGRVAKLYTHADSMSIQYMGNSRTYGEYLVLNFGYAFPDGKGPQASVGGITSTPRIRLLRAQ